MRVLRARKGFANKKSGFGKIGCVCEYLSESRRERERERERESARERVDALQNEERFFMAKPSPL